MPAKQEVGLIVAIESKTELDLAILLFCIREFYLNLAS